MKNYAKLHPNWLMIAVPSNKLPTKIQPKIFIFTSLKNLLTVIKAKEQEIGPGREYVKIAFLYK